MRIWSVLTFIILVVCSTYTSQAQNPLTPETLLKIPRISEPRISPDGKMVAYTRRDVNIQENKTTSTIYVVPTAGGTPKRFSPEGENAYHPYWLTNNRIAYLSKVTGAYNVWELDIDGKNKHQLTLNTSNVEAFQYAADLESMWFHTPVKMEKDPSQVYKDLPYTVNAKIIDGLMYRHWSSWHDGTYNHIFTAKIEDGKLLEGKNVLGAGKFNSPMKPFGGSEQINFSPDGKYIAYTCKKLGGTEAAKSTNSDIYVFDIENFNTLNLTEENKGYDINPEFSADGKWMIYLSMETPGYEADKSRLILLNLENGEKTDLTSNFDNSIDMAKWDPYTSDRVYAIAGIQATHNIFVFYTSGPQKGRWKQLTRDEVDYQDFSVAKINGKTTLAASRMSISNPTEIYLVDAETGVAKQLTKETEAIMKDVKMGRVEKRMVTTTDGKSMLTWVIYPPDFDQKKKYPALLYCQGGPQSTVSQFFSYRWNFQLMAANDYIVVAPNRRGLPSFGQEWNAAISGDWGGQAMNDLLSAIDNVKNEPFVDAERLGAVGASFGGYSVYWLAGQHQNRFKAFISHCGVYNLESMYGSTEEIFFTNHDLGGAYWDKPTPVSYEKFSPHKFVKNWNTPILIVHNELDYRVPLSQGMEAFTAAQLLGVPSRFLYFPDEGHWVSKPQNSLLWQREFFGWLNKYLK
jgi:dipeptidyl aminopeptidase/acylaminoacyl peptidase